MTISHSRTDLIGCLKGGLALRCFAKVGAEAGGWMGTKASVVRDALQRGDPFLNTKGESTGLHSDVD